MKQHTHKNWLYPILILILLTTTFVSKTNPVHACEPSDEEPPPPESFESWVDTTEVIMLGEVIEWTPDSYNQRHNVSGIIFKVETYLKGSGPAIIVARGYSWGGGDCRPRGPQPGSKLIFFANGDPETELRVGNRDNTYQSTIGVNQENIDRILAISGADVFKPFSDTMSQTVAAMCNNTFEVMAEAIDSVAREADIVVEGSIKQIEPVAEWEERDVTITDLHYFRGEGSQDLTISGFGNGRDCRPALLDENRQIFFIHQTDDGKLMAQKIYFGGPFAVAKASPENRRIIMGALGISWWDTINIEQMALFVVGGVVLVVLLLIGYGRIKLRKNR